jgi:hypothetical protein
MKKVDFVFFEALNVEKSINFHHNARNEDDIF